MRGNKKDGMGSCLVRGGHSEIGNLWDEEDKRILRKEATD